MSNVISIFALFLLIALAINGCAGADGADETSTEISHRELTANGMYNDGLPDSEARRRVEVISTELGLLSSLGNYEHNMSDEEISSIDFTNEQVVMVSLGLVNQSYDLEFSSIEVFSEYVKLQYTITKPCMGCIVTSSGIYLMKVFVVQSKKPIIVEERMNIVGEI